MGTASIGTFGACWTHATSCALPAFLPGASSEERSSSATKGTAAKILVPLPASSRRQIFHGPDGFVPAYSPGPALDSSSLLQRQSLRLRLARRVEPLPLWRIRPRRIAWFRYTSPRYAELPGRFGTGTARYLSADASVPSSR